MTRRSARAPESLPAPKAEALRAQLRDLITPDRPPRPTRDGDLPSDLKEGAALGDRWHRRTIEITSIAYADAPITEGLNATLEVRWESSRMSDGTLYAELAIGSHHEREFRCTSNNAHEATFTPAHPHIIRALATLLTELADRVEADHAAYALLEQVRR